MISDEGSLMSADRNADFDELRRGEPFVCVHLLLTDS